MAIRILATGDIHIGQRVSGIPDTGISARSTWNSIVRWCVDNQVDILALTGDIVDQDNNFFEAIGPLQWGFSLLRDNNINVVMVAGNHDYNVLPQVADQGEYENVKMLGRHGKWELHSLEIRDQPIRFAGWSFPSQYVREDPLLKFDLEVTGPTPCIGLLHGEVTSTGSEYGPLSLNRLNSLPVDCWILGHIHKPQEMNSLPYICYTGSPLAFSTKEQGQHGPILVTVENGRINKPERVLFSPVRFENIVIDVTGSETEDDFKKKIISGLKSAGEDRKEELDGVQYLVCDVSFTGTHNKIRDLEAWSGSIRDLEINNGNLTKRINRTSFNVIPGLNNLHELAKLKSPVGILAGTIIAIRNGETNPFIERMCRDFRNNYSSTCNSEVFLPLGLSDKPDEEPNSMSRRYILKESTRILSELLQQSE